jgi:hypothetical protein
MKLEHLIPYLRGPEKLVELYSKESLNSESEAILVYMENSLSLGSKISFFDIEDTDDDLNYLCNDVTYIQLLPLDLIKDLIESTLDIQGMTNREVALRILEYRVNDA